MKAKKAGIALAVLGLTVGFAAVSTTLSINGTTTIKSNKEDFVKNIKFTAATIDEGTASHTDTTVTFTTKDFTVLGDTATLNYTITNASTYDAEFGANPITCTASDANYITVTPGNELNNQKVATGSSIDGTVVVKLAKSYVEDTAKDVTITCEIDANALEAADMN